MFILKLDGNGNQTWKKTFTENNNSSSGSSVEQTTDGGFIVVGSSFDQSLNYSAVFLVKTDGNGNATFMTETPLYSDKKLQKITDVLGRRTKEKRNTPLFYIFEDGTVEKKLILE